MNKKKRPARAETRQEIFSPPPRHTQVWQCIINILTNIVRVQSMSIFRSRIGNGKARTDADSTAGVFKVGDVVERSPSAPATLVRSGAHSTGFPGLRPSRYLGSGSSIEKKERADKGSADQNLAVPVSTDNFSDENLRTVLSMTPEEATESSRAPSLSPLSD